MDSAVTWGCPRLLGGSGDELGSSPVDPTDRSRSLCASHTETNEKQTGHWRRAALGELVSTCFSCVYPMFIPITGRHTAADLVIKTHHPFCPISAPHRSWDPITEAGTPHRSWDPPSSGITSLGFSRQEHWNGLPFSSPVHESEK